MPAEIELTNAAHERSTYSIDISFYDEEGNPVIPKTGLKWSLTKADGTTIVNAKKDTIITPAAMVTILLSGADLALDIGEKLGYRYVIVEGTYDSTLGTNLPFKDHIKFPIIDIAKVPA